MVGDVCAVCGSESISYISSEELLAMCYECNSLVHYLSASDLAELNFARAFRVIFGGDLPVEYREMHSYPQ